MTQFSAHLISVDSGQHQIKEQKIRMKRVKFFQRLFPVIYDFCLKAFLCKIQRNQFCNVVIIINDKNFLFGCH